MIKRLARRLVIVLSLAMGLLAFAYPFVDVAAGAPHGSGTTTSTAGALFITVALVAMLLELQSDGMDARSSAMIGVLVAITSILRFIEIAVPLPGGFSPIFAPILIVGWVFGGQFGFLMGSLTMLVSGLITGGIGPWLPYQMFSAGWVGMGAGVARGLRDVLRPRQTSFDRWDLAVLVAMGILWGLLYGAIINLYFWPYAVGSADQTWSVGIGLGQTLKRYALFYAASSFLWDLARSAGNAALLLAVGMPAAKALERFERRFSHEIVREVAPHA